MKAQDLKNIQTVDVYQGEQRAGTLTRTPKGSVFEYDPHFLEERRKKKGAPGLAYNIGFSHPTCESFGVNLHPFFAGLLPEGLRVNVLFKTLKTSEDDLFTLLLAVGADAVGDVTVVAPGERPLDFKPTENLIDVETIAFRDLFSESLTATILDRQHYEPAVPGVHEKISATRLSFPIGVKGRQKQYILKLSAKEYPQIVENEHFFMEAAKSAGLEVAATSIVEDKNKEKGLLVERFDRVHVEKKVFLKIHQEDACQFLDVYPDRKYLLKCSEIVERMQDLCSSPAVETAAFLRLYAFSYLIGNGDLHAKNISLCTDPVTGNIKMTPAYDLLSTWPYADHEMALEIEGRKNEIRRTDYINFGERFGIERQVLRSLLDDVVNAADSFLPRLAEIGLSEKKTDDLRKAIMKRREDLAQRNWVLFDNNMYNKIVFDDDEIEFQKQVQTILNTEFKHGFYCLFPAPAFLESIGVGKIKMPTFTSIAGEKSPDISLKSMYNQASDFFRSRPELLREGLLEKVAQQTAYVRKKSTFAQDFFKDTVLRFIEDYPQFEEEVIECLIWDSMQHYLDEHGDKRALQVVLLFEIFRDKARAGKIPAVRLSVKMANTIDRIKPDQLDEFHEDIQLKPGKDLLDTQIVHFALMGYLGKEHGDFEKVVTLTADDMQQVKKRVQVYEAAYHWMREVDSRAILPKSLHPNSGIIYFFNPDGSTSPERVEVGDLLPDRAKNEPSGL